MSICRSPNPGKILAFPCPHGALTGYHWFCPTPTIMQTGGIYMHLRSLAGLAVVSALAMPASAEDAARILAQVSSTYQGLTSYHFEGLTVSESKTKNVDSKSETQFVFAFTQPNRFRVEVRYPQAGNWVRVSDGKTLSNF